MRLPPDLTIRQAITKAAALKELGQTEIYVSSRDEDAKFFPWDCVTGIQDTGSRRRFSGPIGFYVIAETHGLTFKLDVDFEAPIQDGKPYSAFDAPRLREVAMKLTPDARRQLFVFLASRVLPDLSKRTDEMREQLHMQWSSEDTVRGLIEFLRAK